MSETSLAPPHKRKRSVSDSPEAETTPAKHMNGTNGNNIVVKDKVTHSIQRSRPQHLNYPLVETKGLFEL